MNIILLKAFDARLFAMYVKRLSNSLQRGTSCSLSSNDARTILRDVASALEYLESQKVVHNGIKPSNMAYSPSRGAVLLDFGLATYSNEPTSTGGTPWYVPPEYRTDNIRGTAGDIWALGVTMLYILRKTPLPERTVMDWLICDATVRLSEASRRMMAWVDKVSQMRNTLERATNTVEKLVYSMLEEKPDLRIRAGQIVAVLQSPVVSSTSKTTS